MGDPRRRTASASSSRRRRARRGCRAARARRPASARRSASKRSTSRPSARARCHRCGSSRRPWSAYSASANGQNAPCAAAASAAHAARQRALVLGPQRQVAEDDARAGGGQALVGERAARAGEVGVEDDEACRRGSPRTWSSSRSGGGGALRRSSPSGMGGRVRREGRRGSGSRFAVVGARRARDIAPGAPRRRARPRGVSNKPRGPRLIRRTPARCADPGPHGRHRTDHTLSDAVRPRDRHEPAARSARPQPASALSRCAARARRRTAAMRLGVSRCECGRDGQVRRVKGAPVAGYRTGRAPMPRTPAGVCRMSLAGRG